MCELMTRFAYPIKREDVVIDSVVGEVGVLDATVGDGLSCFLLFLGGEFL